MGLTPLNLHYWQADRESGEDKEDWEVHNKQIILMVLYAIKKI